MIVSIRAGSTTFILYALQPALPRSNTSAGTAAITAQLSKSPQAQGLTWPNSGFKAPRRVVSARPTATMPAVPGSLRQVTKVGIAIDKQPTAICWQDLGFLYMIISKCCQSLTHAHLTSAGTIVKPKQVWPSCCSGNGADLSAYTNGRVRPADSSH